MKLTAYSKVLLINIFLFAMPQARSQVAFSDYFTGERLRVEYSLSGNANECKISDVVFYQEPVWGGNPIHLIDTFRYGEMLVEVFDSESGILIYSRGYSTLFQEWQTVEEAKKKDSLIVATIQLPYPKKSVRIRFKLRIGAEFKTLFQTRFRPGITAIRKTVSPAGSEVRMLQEAGEPEKKMDIALLAEGYTEKEKDRFFEDAKHLADRFLQWEPYHSLKDSINLYAVYIASDQSGADDPRDSIWVETALGCSFNTFGSDRYLTSRKPQLIFDLVSEIPWDQVCVLVNTSKYGGGGVYNSFTFLSAGNEEFAEFLLMHEFGHAFAALADEYYTSSVAYSEFFDLDKEPYQPNITTLVDFDRKWKSMLNDSIPVPTPDSSIYDGVVGVFEGAGYSAKGIYRPYRSCTMKDKYTMEFCPVCREAIADMIRFHSAW